MSEEGGAHRSRFCVGAVSVGIAGRRSDDVALGRSLRPFRVETYRCDVNLTVEWVRDLGPAPGRQLFDSGATWRLYQRENGFQFDFIARDQLYKRLLVDNLFREATLQMSAEYFDSFLGLAADPLGYPLDELLIMHRLTQEKAIELHSCGIVLPDGTGNLFVGHSGAGKSTTTRLWTEREDVEVLSDDRIIVRRDENAPSAETPFGGRVTTERVGILRLRDSSASRSNHFAQDDRVRVDDQKTKQIPHRAFGPIRNDKGKMRMYGTPWHGEAMYASPGSSPLTRIFVLEHGHGNVITRLSPSQAVAELFARSFVPFHRHEYVDSALQFLQELVDTVPCYRYSFEPDRRAVETVQEFQD
jgi:hypothetical protein